MFFRLECEHATSSLFQMTESENSQSKRIQKIKRAIYSKEKFNKELFFKLNEFIV